MKAVLEEAMVGAQTVMKKMKVESKERVYCLDELQYYKWRMCPGVLVLGFKSFRKTLEHLGRHLKYLRFDLVKRVTGMPKSIWF